MRTLRAWLVRLAGTLGGNRREREMAAELESHFQLHIDDNIRAGMTPAEARRAAVAKFGPIEAIKDDYRDRAGIPFLEIFLQDLRYAARRLRQQPGFTALVVLTLALGIGANTAMFGFVDRLLFRPPAHVVRPDRVVQVEQAANYVRFRALAERLQSLQLAAFAHPWPQSLGAGASAKPIRPQCVTADFFSVLGVPAILGTTFTPDDERSRTTRGLVLSHAYWTGHFAADPSIVGREFVMSRHPYRVVGVAPRGFAGVGGGQADAWILMAQAGQSCDPYPAAGGDILQSESSGWLRTLGRLRDDVSFDGAAAELAAAEAHRKPFVTNKGEVIDMRATLKPMFPSRTASLTDEGRLALWLAGGAGILLLLACSNIAGLLSARAVDRRREIAIRLQLGGSRGRVARQLLTEHLLVCAIGAIAALIVAAWLSGTLASYLAFDTGEAVVDTRLLAVLTGVAILAGLASGTWPALHATRRSGVTHLRTGCSVVPGRSRASTALVALQIAFAVMLVIGAGLFVQSVARFRDDFAYDLERVAIAEIDMLRDTAGRRDDAWRAYTLLLDRVRALPDVESAAVTTGSVGFGGTSSAIFMGLTARGANDTYTLSEVTPDYFDTVGVRLTRGRPFSADDARSATPPIILNEDLAQTLFGGADAIGSCVFVGGGCRRVIGISEPFRARPPAGFDKAEAFSPARPQVGDGDPPQFLLVRTRGPVRDQLQAIAGALQGASPDLPFITVQPLMALVDEQGASWLLGATTFGLFGVLALVMAVIGIYGTLAFSVRQRTLDIAVRLALGAPRTHVAALVLRQGAVTVLLGTVVGGVAAFVASRAAQAVLFNVAPGDARTFAAGVAVVALAALVGCVVPLRRAARVDPIAALRYE